MKALDYSLKDNWIVNESNKSNTDYDLIFLCGTSINNPGLDNGVGTDLNEMKIAGYRNYSFIGSSVNDNARVFCPVQRQLALAYALNYTNHNMLLDEIHNKEPFCDLCAAFDYYFEHYNKDGNKPFVLAGHSQGACSLQVMLEHYFLRTEKRKYLKNLVCLYSLGYGVSKKWFNDLPLNGAIHFADGEDDYNSVVSWNIEGAGEKGHSFLLSDDEYDTLVINPLNWKKDESYAPKELNKGVYMDDGKPINVATVFFTHEEKYLFDAQIDLKRGSVITNSSRNYMVFPGVTTLWGGKSLHNYDGRGYYFNLKDNVRKRVNKFFKERNY